MLRILFFLVVASIPIQLSKFFFIDESYVLGLPIDYRAISIYLSDILVIIFLTAFAYYNFRNLPAIFKSYKAAILAIILFDLYLIADNLFISQSLQVSLFFTLKTIIFSLLVPTTAYMLSEKTSRSFAKAAVVVSLGFAALLIIVQFILQRSVGFTFLGERSFDSATTSIAHVNFLGNQLLRPYGTFPHPNVAAAVLATGLILVFNLKRKFLLALTLIAIALTFSKTALVFLAAATMLSARKTKDILIRVLLIASVGVAGLSTLPKLDLTTLAERLTLAQAALDITVKNPLSGSGSTNFIAELAKLNLFSISSIRLLQPVHNVFLLILTENGIVGLLLFVYILYTVTKRNMNRSKIIIVTGLLIFATFDHFLWTLQQGQLLLWLSLGYILADPKARDTRATRGARDTLNK